jgi:hypothetical protein
MRNASIIDALKQVDADILVLTETNEIIDLSEKYEHSFRSDLLPSLKDSISYNAGENRTTIWSKYPGVIAVGTFNSFTSVCATLQTPHGALNVYGTIIGILGNREASFMPDLEKQIADWKAIRESGDICIVGDFNISFADSYYYTKDGRRRIDDCFAELEIKNLTRGEPDNIDHIAISQSFVKNAKHETQVWNQDKQLSDHIGVSVELIYSSTQ